MLILSGFKLTNRSPRKKDVLFYYMGTEIINDINGTDSFKLTSLWFTKDKPGTRGKHMRRVEMPKWTEEICNSHSVAQHMQHQRDIASLLRVNLTERGA